MTEKTSIRERNIFRKGETQRKNGTYAYRWQDAEGKRHTVYAPDLDRLRAIEEEILQDQQDRIKPEARGKTVNDLYAMWTQLKRGLKDNTFQNYQYMYRQFVAPSFGKRKISTLLKSDVKRFYNTLVDERGLSISTVDGIHNVLHQVPNQKIVRIEKEPCGKGNLYAAINLKALEAAAQNLDAGAFKLWIYFAKNQNGYEFALSSKDANTTFGLGKSQYDTGLKLDGKVTDGIHNINLLFLSLLVT